MTLWNNARQLLCRIWSERWSSNLSFFEDKALHVHDSRIYRVTVRSASRKHPNAARGCIASQDFSKSYPVGNYYGTLVFTHLENFSDNEVHGGMMVMSGWEFCRPAIQRCEQLYSIDERVYTVWPVPANFNFFRYMKDSRIVEGKVFEDGDAVASKRTADVIFDLNATYWT